jgi:hypothetical protein
MSCFLCNKVMHLLLCHSHEQRMMSCDYRHKKVIRGDNCSFMHTLCNVSCVEIIAQFLERRRNNYSVTQVFSFHLCVILLTFSPALFMSFWSPPPSSDFICYFPMDSFPLSFLSGTLEEVNLADDTRRE